MSETTHNDAIKPFSLTLGEENGYDLVWLHGWGQSHKSLLELASLFTKTAKNILFDLPGFGASPMLAPGATTRDYADWVRENLGPKSGLRILIGHSYGGRVAVQMAANYQDDIDGIILISGAGLKRERSIFWHIRSAYLRGLGKLAKIFDSIFNTGLRETYSNKFGSVDYKNSGALKGTFISAITENLTKEAASISCPTLLIYGEEDNETPPEIGQKFKDLIKGSKLKVLKGFDHLNILNHGKNQCQSLISRFLEDIKPHD